MSKSNGDTYTKLSFADLVWFGGLFVIADVNQNKSEGQIRQAVCLFLMRCIMSLKAKVSKKCLKC